ncbi:glycosyltransferase family protein [Spirosoma agri]|uniref:Glycosyltransferase family 4 protein n=1 Tax=Spirosoma agri TaxID=1987381 RepID=A0A6M0IJ88_9BACT|nr:glycosyltransferase family 4 protein [Spirosoma agri]NEU67441.1 glycosyltransferase family 4 protein [Spirosoma agri]
MLNIVFLCPSLEPGRDGVGDYTRQLASELILQGHQVSLVALNDKALTDECMGVQTANGVSIPVLRIPAIWSSKQRFERAKKWVDTIEPDWLSLQYVPFGFHNKGLTFGLGNYLKQLGCDRKWHIMFHELWVGMEQEASFKHKIWGLLQEALVYALLTKLDPSVVHTHTQLYQLSIAKGNSNVAILPLPSNIPVYSYNNQLLHKDKKLESTISFVIFGSVHHGAPVKEFASEVSHFCKSTGLLAELVLIGKYSVEQQRWKKAWLDQALSVIDTGEQPATKVSEALSNATFGITTTPFALVDKSSVVATMKAHGLPVICVSRPWKPRNSFILKLPTGILDYQVGNLKQYLLTQHSELKSYKLVEIVTQFLHDLHNN